MANDKELIRKIDFFQPLHEKIISKIADVCIEREYSTGDYIVKQGETGLGLFFITSGKVKVEIESNGSKTVVAQLKDEDFFGELAIIDNKPRSANVVSLEDTRCLLLTRDSFSKLMNRYPEIAIQMAKSLAQRVRETTERMTHHGSPEAGASTNKSASETPAQPADSKAPDASSPATTAATSSPPANGPSSKNKVRDFLVDTFSRFYTVKALTRFSVAVVGCPVNVRAERVSSQVIHDVVGGVKLVLFPASQEQVLRIHAVGEGDFSATVLRPGSPETDSPFSISHFARRVSPNEILRLHVSGGEKGCTWLES